jgi:hypothetical protein
MFDVYVTEVSYVNLVTPLPRVTKVMYEPYIEFIFGNPAYHIYGQRFDINTNLVTHCNLFDNTCLHFAFISTHSRFIIPTVSTNCWKLFINNRETIGNTLYTKCVHLYHPVTLPAILSDAQWL